MEIRVTHDNYASGRSNSLGFDFRIDDIHDNIVVESTLEDFFNNFNDIPMEALQDFVNKYKKK